MTYLINRHPCCATRTTMPYALLFSVAPSYEELCVFGCRCFPNMITTSSHKLTMHSMSCVFIRYPVDHHRYCCYEIMTGQVIALRHIVFDKAVFPFHDTTTTIAAASRLVACDPPLPPPTNGAHGIMITASHHGSLPPLPPRLDPDRPRHPTRARTAC